MGKGRNKGASYEREFCRELSAWWTNGKRDDVFWRTAGSGGMATSRTRRGKSAHGQHGDIQAVDPSGAPLLRLCTIELKRGHKDAHLGDLVDRSEAQELGWLATFLLQAHRESREAGRPFWLLVVRRDRRDAILYMPEALREELKHEGVSMRSSPCGGLYHEEIGVVFFCKWNRFVERVTPKVIKRIEKEFR